MDSKGLIIALLMATLCCGVAHSREPYDIDFDVAFYNTQNLFDTIPSPFSSDEEYTPDGYRRWNGERYQAKIEAVSRVIDDLSADVIALSEIENEDVVRDLVMATETPYAYIHQNSSDSRGIDIAVLYRPERLFIDSVDFRRVGGHYREAVTIFGEIDDRNVIITACHLPSQFNSKKRIESAAKGMGEYLGELVHNNPKAFVIAVGDFNFTPRSTYSSYITGDGETIYNKSIELEDYGLATYIYGNRKLIYDQILVSNNIKEFSAADIFIRDYLIEQSRSSSLSIKPTFRGRRYVGGASDHLPVVLRVRR